MIVYSGDQSQFLAVRFDAIELIWKTRGGSAIVRVGGDNYCLPDAVDQQDIDKILEEWNEYCNG